MEFKILKEEFLQVLGHLQGVVEKKHVMPILANILLEAEENILRVSATDLEVAVNVSAQADVSVKGKITVNAFKFTEIVREAGGADITVRVTDNSRVEITSLSNQCKIMALPATEFPKLPEPEGKFATVAAPEFMELLERVSFAVSADETRRHLNGVYLEKQGSDVVAAATDGHRLALDKAAFELTLPEQGGIIVPRKGVNELKKLIAGEKAFELSLDKRHVFARTERFTLFIRLIDGEFPNYTRVIPESSKIKVSIPREALQGALRRVSILADTHSHGVKLYFCHDALLVNAANFEVGEAREEIPVSYTGEAVEVSFNANYLQDVLNVLKDENVVLGFNDKALPCVVLSPSAKDFVAVIMPMRV